MIRLDKVVYKHPVDFLRFVNTRNSSDSNIKTVVDFDGASLLIAKNLPPTYWTSFDDTYLVCDSYDEEVDDTLKASKTQCLAVVLPSWEHIDEFIPQIPEEAFPALLAEIKSSAFLKVKEVASQKDEQESRRQRAWLSRKDWRAAGGITYPDFGRK
jgi:hypothetical protein